MNQIERITQMEQNLDRIEQAMNDLSVAWEQYKELLPIFEELVAYYESPAWQQDFSDDSAGKLPQSLKRGVLSEDAVYDLLYEHQQLLLDMQKSCLENRK